MCDSSKHATPRTTRLTGNDPASPLVSRRVHLVNGAAQRRFDHDLYTSSKTAERVLNAAIVRAEITESLEEYAEYYHKELSPFIEILVDAGGEPSDAARERTAHHPR